MGTPIWTKPAWYVHCWFRCQAWYAHCLTWKTAWTWRMLEYLYPRPHRSPRLSLADIRVSKRHPSFWWITFENVFPAVPEAPPTVFAVIRNCFSMYSVSARFYPFKSGILLINSYGLLMRMVSIMFWITLFLGVT